MKINSYEDIKNITFKDYLKIVNPDNTRHSSEAYSFDTEKLNEHMEASQFPILINNFTQNGLDFQLREKIIDRAEGQFYKTQEVKIQLSDDEFFYDTVPMKDKNNEYVYLTLDEKIEMLGNRRYEYEQCIYNKTENLIVGYTADEWNCLLVVVGSEFKGLGLGIRLFEANRKRHPTRHSGGYTPAGEKTEYKHYCNVIKKALSEGYYTKSINNETLTKEQVLKILTSANIVKDETYIPEKKKVKNDNNLNLKKEEDFLVNISNNCIIIYNKDIFKMLDEYNNSDNQSLNYFLEKAIIGYAHITDFNMIHENSSQLLNINSDSFIINQKMIELFLNIELEHGLIKIKPEHLKYLEGLDVELNHDKEHTYCQLKHRTIDDIQIQLYNIVENSFRNKHDEYDEKWCQIQEMAYQLGNYEKERKDIKTKILTPEEYVRIHFQSNKELKNAITQIIKKPISNKGNSININKLS